MQPSGDSEKKDFYSYSRRFEPVAFKSGRPKLWAVELFRDEMHSRFGELQGYISDVTKRRDVVSPRAAYDERSLKMEHGALWRRMPHLTYLDKTGKLSDIGSPFKISNEIQDDTYLLVYYRNVEEVTVAGKKPALYPEFELFVVSTAEDFCQNIQEDLEHGLPYGIVKGKPKRIGVSMNERQQFTVSYNEGLSIGKSITVAHTRFG